jgi:proteasome assembly chaperone (PAC2) family protein
MVMESGASFTFLERPKLRRPYMVCGIGGWVDGGTAATGSVRYLVRRLEARKLAEMPASPFQIWQLPGLEALRPHVKIQDGLIVEQEFPSNEFFYSTNVKGNNDAVLFLGREPNLNWQEYADGILRVADEFGVIRIYLLGGVLDRCPHTREPKVSCACTSMNLKEEMSNYAVGYSNYEGPSRFGNLLLCRCKTRGMEMVTLTVRATHYAEHNVMIPHNPKAIRALVKRLNHMLGLKLSLEDLDQTVQEFEAKVDFAVNQSDKFKAYVEELEKAYQEVPYEEPLDLSGEEAVEMVQEYLQDDKTGS